MKIYRNIKNFSAQNPVITVGTFDGVHLGHIQIFNKVKEKARAINGESVVVTFWPHPRLVLDPNGDKINMINTIDEKIKLIGEQEIDHLIILKFTKTFAKLSSCDFIEQYLFNKLKIKALIVGYDHHFGRDREGGFEVLSACAKKYNFSVEKVEAYALKNEKISSTVIRDAILKGDFEKANTFLSKKYFISGQIIGGKKIGRNLGFPTANIYIAETYKIVPGSGVYAVETEIKGKRYAGMLNIGYKPTINIDKSNRSIEVHILNFNDDIYDEDIRVYFHKRIRNELKFCSLEKLKQQLIKDKALVSNYFNLT
ncbi:MAG: bifunctional riboflavin kinase/FAD synthetase [Bacteroidota bacterium]